MSADEHLVHNLYSLGKVNACPFLSGVYSLLFLDVLMSTLN